MNSIYYNADLDQIMLNVRGCRELWIIAHSTTTEEAKGVVFSIAGAIQQRMDTEYLLIEKPK